MKRNKKLNERQALEGILRETFAAKIVADEANAKYNALRKQAIAALQDLGVTTFTHYDGTTVTATIAESSRALYEKTVERVLEILQTATPENAYTKVVEAVNLLQNPPTSKFFVLRFSVKD